MKLIFEEKYDLKGNGSNKIYPHCENSNIFCNLVGKKSLNEYQLKLIKQLGYSIEIKVPYSRSHKIF